MTNDDQRQPRSRSSASVASSAASATPCGLPVVGELLTCLSKGRDNRPIQGPGLGVGRRNLREQVAVKGSVLGTACGAPRVSPGRFSAAGGPDDRVRGGTDDWCRLSAPRAVDVSVLLGVIHSWHNLSAARSDAKEAYQSSPRLAEPQLRAGKPLRRVGSSKKAANVPPTGGTGRQQAGVVAELRGRGRHPMATADAPQPRSHRSGRGSPIPLQSSGL
jgi:hypothetical protein